MHILLLRHYPRVEGASMRAYSEQIVQGLQARGHRVHQITAPVIISRFVPRRHPAAKWLGYLDQFILFPPFLFLRALLMPPGSLCVLMDQALGPWFPWLAGRPHLVHCHDLLALEGAEGMQPFHRLSLTGRIYQRWIHYGFRRARFFLSVSHSSCQALEAHLPSPPLLSEVLYNALPPRFTTLPPQQTQLTIHQALPELRDHPFLLHIGRQWYKNRLGVIAIWDELRLQGLVHHLVLVGSSDPSMQEVVGAHPQIHVLDRASDDLVVALYNRASALLFPSHAEGFGWPVLEALGCGCPVITTARPPMTEVGGDAAFYVPPAPVQPSMLGLWAKSSAKVVEEVLNLDSEARQRVSQQGLKHAQNFSMERWVDQLELHYRHALELQGVA